MLYMDNLQERKPLKKYFYGDGNIFLSILLFIKRLLGSYKGEEKLYDDIVERDIEYIKSRSVSTMGLIEEEYSLIDPIVAYSFASEDSVKFGSELTAETKNLLQMIEDIILGFPKMVFSFIRSLFGSGDCISKAVFYEGDDHVVRGSLVSVTVVLFTEQQVVAYTCNYDIALGVILEETVREVFYRDVDSVNYGDETLHVLGRDGNVIRTMVTKLRLAVASGRDIVAAMAGESDLLENQIMATKSLIRSKKETLA